MSSERTLQICDVCDATTYKLYSHPGNGSEQKVCEDCEYTIIESLSEEIPDPDEPKDYGSVTHGF